MKKRIIFALYTAIFMTALIIGCEKSNDEGTTPDNAYGKLEGTWMIDQRVVINDVNDGDGSWIKFNNCNEPPCTGLAYDAANDTEGPFTYEILENDTKVNIIDEDPRNGGYYNTTWIIQKLESDKLEIIGSEGFWANEIIKLTK